MGMVVILVMWPGLFEQTLVPPSQGGLTWNSASIGPVVSEDMFENVDVRRTTEACLYYKLTSEPKGSGELKSQMTNFRQCQGLIPLAEYALINYLNQSN